MICSLIRCICFSATVLVLSSSSSAAVIFDLRSTAAPSVSIVGNVLTVVRSGLSSGGVSFNATLTVTGNQPFVATSTTGMGTGIFGDNNVNVGDVLTFAMTVSVLSPGAVVFDGFEKVYIEGLGNLERATLNRNGGGGETINGPFTGALGLQYSPLLSYPTDITLSGQAGSYQVSQIDAIFTGSAAAVPEPSIAPAIFAFIGTSLLAGRFRRRTNSVDSGSLVA